jgi:IPT/TIG domain/Bacterial Ig-like domain (group 3)
MKLRRFRGDGRHVQSGRRWLVLGAAAMVGLIGLGATALPASGAAPPPKKPGSIRYLKTKPRTATPRHHGRPAPPSGLHVQGGVPPSIRGGRPEAPAPVISDGRTATNASVGKLSTAAGPLVATGSFANLLALTGATFGNVCTPTPTGGCSGPQPPDTQMAAGRNEITEAVNNNVFVFSRGGTQLDSFPATDLFQPAGQTVGLTDPKILFDPTAGVNGLYYLTFMVCSGATSCNGNWSHMGISLAVTSDPTGPWTIYDYINDGNNLQDQEKLGFSSDKVTYAVNEYNCKTNCPGSSFLQENVVVLQKSDLIAGVTVDGVVRSENDTDGFIFDSMPTTPVNASTSDTTQYVVWNLRASSDNEMAVIRITGTPDGGDVDFDDVTKISISDMTCATTSPCAPPAGVQPGGTVATDKMNFQSAMVQGNDLWAIGTDSCTPQYPSADTTLRACTRLVEVDLSDDSLAFDADVGTTGTYRYNPSVMKDASGHVFFGFTISSATQYPTAAIDGSTVPPPAVLQRIDFASGDATYTGNRWGDYSGTQQDPLNTNDVWSAQEFGACTTACSSTFGGNWATAIGQFTFSEPHITSISPNHGPATGGTTVDIFGSEFANGGTTAKFGTNTSSSVTWIDSTHVRAVSPPGDSGTVDITAMTGAGTSDTSSADQFTYNPFLTSVVPNNGPAAGGQSVTISGAGLNGATAVTFGETAAASFSVVNSSTITAVTPAHEGGTVDLTVTTSGGGTSNAIPYTFQFPTTTSLTSSANPSIVGASVTYTATVSPVPNGGTVSFSDNASPMPGCQALPVNTSTGVATCTVTYTSVGSHSIIATYSGNFYYSGSTSPTLVQQVTYAVVALYDQTRPVNSGATVAIKVQLRDAAGNDVSSSAIVLTVTGLTPSPAPGTPPSGTFTFLTLPDSGPGYQLNVKTTHYPPNTYTLSFTATGDPVTHTVQFVVR